MTMHLVGPYMTTTNYKKRKKKPLTENQRTQLEAEWRKHNKDMRRKNMHSMQIDTFEQYLLYIRGEYVPKRKEPEFKEYKPNYDYENSTRHIPSAGNGIGVATRKESVKYTGDLICGIATMHKSNAVPVMRGTKQAEEIAKMRR
jgi:hypothetical protein